MAMQFYQAGRAENPNLAAAMAQQAKLDQQARNAAQLRAQSNLMGMAGLVKGAAESGIFGNAAGAGASGTLASIPGYGWGILGALALGNYLMNK